MTDVDDRASIATTLRRFAARLMVVADSVPAMGEDELATARRGAATLALATVLAKARKRARARR